MISTSKVLPNFIKSAIKTTLFVIVAAFSATTFADDHATQDKIGDLKDMSTETATTQADEITSALTEKATDAEGAAEDAEAEADDITDALKAKMPEG